MFLSLQSVVLHTILYTAVDHNSGTDALSHNGSGSGGMCLTHSSCQMYPRAARYSGLGADANDTYVGTVRQAGRARGKGGWGGAQKGAGATPGKQDQAQA